MWIIHLSECPSRQVWSALQVARRSHPQRAVSLFGTCGPPPHCYLSCLLGGCCFCNICSASLLLCPLIGKAVGFADEFWGPCCGAVHIWPSVGGKSHLCQDLRQDLCQQSWTYFPTNLTPTTPHPRTPHCPSRSLPTFHESEVFGVATQVVKVADSSPYWTNVLQGFPERPYKPKFAECELGVWEKNLSGFNCGRTRAKAYKDVVPS